MKKALIGIMVLACVALISGTALAATFWSVDVEGKVEFLILDEDGLQLILGPDFAVAGMLTPELTITALPWTAGIDDASVGYITYTAAMGSIGLATEVQQDIYELGEGIDAGPGLVVTADVAPLTLGVIYTDPAVTPQYGIEATYAAGNASVGIAFNSLPEYGVQLGLTMVPMTATVSSALSGTNVGDYKLEIEAALAAGTLTLGYVYDSGGATGTLSAGVADLPLTASTLLAVELTNDGVNTVLTGTATTDLGGGVTLTTTATSDPSLAPAATFTYDVLIGVSF